MSELLRDPDLDELVKNLNQSEGQAGESELAPAAGEVVLGFDLEDDIGGGDGIEIGAAEELSNEPVAPLGSSDIPLQRSPYVAGQWAEVPAGSRLRKLLREMIQKGASDLLLVHGEPPVHRVNGRLRKGSGSPLKGASIEALLAPHLAPPARSRLAGEGATDLSLRLSPGSEVAAPGRAYRFRVNVHRQRGELAASIRALPREIPTLADLNLSPALARLIEPTRGLVLICGPTGAGKTSTLAALIGEVNRKRRAHILTIEDPVEYEHRNSEAVIEQIEIGRDSPSFSTALRACLRQDPDVILVGEMRDLETISTALTAAETGHLVLSTLHTHDAAQAIHRIVDVFPPQQQGQIRHQLALSLNAIVCQQLVPCRDGSGRVPATEVLLANYPVRNHIRRDTLQNLATEITLGRSQGMISLETSLAALVKAGVIDEDEARIRSAKPDEMESLLRS